MRSGVCALVLVLAAIATPSAGADGSATTTDTTATTTTVDTNAAPAFTAVGVTPLPSGCASTGAAAIVLPHRTPLALGPAPATLGASAYPGAMSILTFASAGADGAACQPGAVWVRALSLFDGAVTADAVTATQGRGTVSGLEVEGVAVTLAPGQSVPIDGWGLLVAADHAGHRLTAPLALHLLKARGGFPAGTVVLIGFGATPAPPVATSPTLPPGERPAPPADAEPAATPTTAERVGAGAHHAKRHKRRRAKHQPLKVTPPLGLPTYVFPVSGGADYGDTYGANRSDVTDGWHHGDDLFAPLGTPILAVASGKLSLVGWNHIGGWRVWLKDARGNTFYYAHLAAYSSRIIKHRNVKAGQVIGFLGRTGDAFTTPPHLHFEIHPKPLLRLGYDGAVDPTRYLRTWHVEQAKDVPQPVVLRAPKGTPREEASVVWRQLLAARHIEASPASATASARSDVPSDANAADLHRGQAADATAPIDAGASKPALSGETLALLLLCGMAEATALAAVGLRYRGRRRGLLGFASTPETEHGAEPRADVTVAPSPAPNPPAASAAPDRSGRSCCSAEPQP